MQRTYSYPSSSWDQSLNRALGDYKLNLQDSKALAKCVLALSSYFIENPEAPTPWKETWAQVAYLCYYLPLNATRIGALIEEADRQKFLEDFEHVIDFGAGLATASLALSEKYKFQFHLIERSREPQQIIEKYFTHFKPLEWLSSVKRESLKSPQKTLALFSYSLTELEQLPEWALECEGLMLVEPSTEQDGRKLLQLREKLLRLGYHVWAPCTHEGPCPLLHQSKHDWCHDRIHFAAPEWFSKMEEHLPMKNRTLTMSYLLMRKTPPPNRGQARVVGDLLREKGKNRQLICRGPEREFLTWMHKLKIDQEIPRGELIKIHQDFEKVSNELRLKSPISR